MKDQTKSFHHYVPQFILRYFSENDMVWVYDRKTNEYRFQSVRSTAGAKGFYTFNFKSGKKTDEIEKLLTKIESNAVDVIKSITLEKKSLNKKEKSDLAMFIAGMYLRNPDSIKNTQKGIEMMTKEIMSRIHRNKDYYDHVWDELVKKGDIPKGSKGKENTRQTFIKKNYDIIVPKEHALVIMIKALLDLFKYIVQMEWKILIAPPKKGYIISDKPAYTVNINPTPDFFGHSLGLFALNCETFCVLTPKISIHLSQKHNPDISNIYEAKEGFIDFLNQATTITSYRFLVSNSHPLLKKWVDKTNLKERGNYHQVKVD